MNLTDNGFHFIHIDLRKRARDSSLHMRHHHALIDPNHTRKFVRRFDSSQLKVAKSSSTCGPTPTVRRSERG